GGRLPRFERLAGGMRAPAWTPSEVMLKGTASRVLFGDPALVITSAFAQKPFDIIAREQEHAVRITAGLANPTLNSTYHDPYHADLASNPQLFNDRALISVRLPTDWESVRRVDVRSVSVRGRSLPNRLVGYAVEREGHTIWLRAQVDVASEDFMKGPLRATGATIELWAWER